MCSPLFAPLLIAGNEKPSGVLEISKVSSVGF
jgi:hypothetical protein